MANYRIREKAKEDLRAIWNYTFDTWSKKQADKYLRELMGEFSNIVADPGRGRNYGAVSPMILGFKKNKHIIFYRIVETGEVEFIRVLHEVMDIPSRLKE